ncbi:hypothetical protein [Vibrio penaeicida]|uniref:Uncharacterized protein n=2 Tax=Vibrio penaeicida TaxID=104609 RepID=A0AAV5NP34_9VIBR|nr:hypothetical protein [Vibrio penaeicida]GLQ72023.1 hypothetical protein GCM10007932_13830 [Vibrio penaeicida]
MASNKYIALENKVRNKRFSLEEFLETRLIAQNTLEDIDRDSLLKLLLEMSEEGARLNQPKITGILTDFGFEPSLTEDENYKFRLIYENRVNGLSSKRLRAVIESDNTDGLMKLEQKIEDLGRRLDNDTPTNNGVDKEDLRKAIDEIAQQSRKLAAPIKMPAPKDMEVQLVSADSLNRLSEYNNDINILLTLCSVFLGAFLGVLGNLFFATEVNNGAIGVTIILAVVAFVFGGLFHRLNNRKENLNKEMLGTEQAVDINTYDQ